MFYEATFVQQQGPAYVRGSLVPLATTADFTLKYRMRKKFSYQICTAATRLNGIYNGFIGHTSCIQFIMHEKCGHSMVNSFEKKMMVKSHAIEIVYKSWI